MKAKSTKAKRQVVSHTVQPVVGQEDLIPKPILDYFIHMYEESGDKKFGASKHCTDRFAYFIAGAVVSAEYESTGEVNASYGV